MLNLPGRIFTRLIINRDQNFLDKEIENRFRHYTAFCMAGMPIMLIFGFSSLMKENFFLAAVIVTCFIGLFTGWFLLYKCISGNGVFRFNSLLFFALVIFLVYIGGEEGSKSLWVFTAPLAAFFLLGTIEGAIWCTITILLCQLIFWNPFGLPLPHPYSNSFAIRFNLAYISISVITYSFEYFRHTYRLEIEKKNRMLEREIRGRKEYEKALKKSEEQYKTVFSQAAEGIMVIDPDGHILESNQQMENSLGMPPSALPGQNILNLIHPDDLKNQPSQIPFMIAGHIIVIERQLRTAEGSYRFFEISGNKIGENTILLVCRDISKRKTAEIALEKANLELERIANIDGLTQIANRRRFDLRLQREWKRLLREDQPLTLIISDIDYFKQYNDLYGHQEGDTCLITIASILDSTLQRPADLAARFGGEEFVILLPNTTIEGGVGKAEEMRKRIVELRIPHNGSIVGPYVTMSFGVSSTVPFKQGIPDDLIAMADKALYQAKQNGRNRVEISEQFIL
ncbi:sensor domain-containing diguanylate cyclase [Desulfopila sp. IMCC35008]|uniref:sensor domain-containing diguanylate cyclase n=1 Tax=Desulfopila sp. IMCC35008 TaxID=2653858 RepID=UPI0013D3542F|nr:sensor domain-containing diguanylate cyclase [Desulfopila sp. IMCC35008]